MQSNVKNDYKEFARKLKTEWEARHKQMSPKWLAYMEGKSQIYDDADLNKLYYGLVYLAGDFAKDAREYEEALNDIKAMMGQEKGRNWNWSYELSHGRDNSLIFQPTTIYAASRRKPMSEIITDRRQIGRPTLVRYKNIWQDGHAETVYQYWNSAERKWMSPE